MLQQRKGTKKMSPSIYSFSKKLIKKSTTFGFEKIKSKGVEEKLLIQVGLHKFN